MWLTRAFPAGCLAAGLFLLPHACADDDAPATTPGVTTNVASAYTPMTHSERVDHYLGSTFSIEAALRAAVGAAILQGMNTPAEWGQGAEGYARRLAND